MSFQSSVWFAGSLSLVPSQYTNPVGSQTYFYVVGGQKQTRYFTKLWHNPPESTDNSNDCTKVGQKPFWIRRTLKRRAAIIWMSFTWIWNKLQPMSFYQAIQKNVLCMLLHKILIKKILKHRKVMKYHWWTWWYLQKS